MRHPLLALVLGISLSLVGAGWIPPAQAAGAHATAQGRTKKKPRKKKAAKPPREKKTVSAKKAADKNRGFEL
jgi:hypothetical protein